MSWPGRNTDTGNGKTRDYVAGNTQTKDSTKKQ